MDRFEAVKAIQSELGLVADGSAGSKTNEAIKKAVGSGKYKLDFNFSNFKILFDRKTIDQKFVNSINGLFQVFNVSIHAPVMDAKSTSFRIEYFYMFQSTRP